MTVEARDALRLQLIRHEGLRLRPYRDSVGLLTIGVGRNLDQVGITREEAMYLLDHDILRAIGDCSASLPWFDALDEIRQRAVVDLCFNMGIGKLLTFTHALDAFAAKDYDRAADNLKMSRWYEQVKGRGVRIVHMVRTGEEPQET